MILTNEIYINLVLESYFLYNMAKTVMEIYEIEKIQSFRRLGVTVECITAYGKIFYHTAASKHP